MEVYIRDYNYDSYKKVAIELIDGKACLLLPQYNKKAAPANWRLSQQGEKIDLGLYFVDGLNAIAALG